TVAGTNRYGAGDSGPGPVLFMLLGDEIERAAEACRVTRRKQVLRRGRARLAGTAHFLWNRQIALDGAVGGFRTSVATPGSGRGGGKYGIDLIHAHLSPAGSLSLRDLTLCLSHMGP